MTYQMATCHAKCQCQTSWQDVTPIGNMWHQKAVCHAKSQCHTRWQFVTPISNLSCKVLVSHQVASCHTKCQCVTSRCNMSGQATTWHVKQWHVIYQMALCHTKWLWVNTNGNVTHTEQKHGKKSINMTQTHQVVCHKKKTKKVNSSGKMSQVIATCHSEERHVTFSGCMFYWAAVSRQALSFHSEQLRVTPNLEWTRPYTRQH